MATKKHKSVDELKIDIDILVIEIGDLSSRRDQRKVLRHLEESLKLLRRDNANGFNFAELTSSEEEDEEEETFDTRHKRQLIEEVRNEPEEDEKEDLTTENVTSEEYELDNTFHSDDVMPVTNLSELATVKDKSLYFTVKDGLYSCILCDFSTDKGNIIKMHLTRHTSNIKCEVCDVYFTRAVNLKRHQEGIQHKARMMAIAGDNDPTEPEPMYACPNAPECNELFATEQELNSHVETTHLFPCQYCQAIFSGEADRFEHMRNDHDMGGRASKQQQSVLEENYECKTCWRTFSSQATLDQHLKSLAHKEMTEQAEHGIMTHGEFKCRHCGKAYDNSRSFRRHLIIHTDKYKCSHCDRCFQEKSRLENHINNNEECSKAKAVTLGQDTYSCQICSKSYCKKEYLSQHMVEHTDKYQCTQCHLTFSNKRRLDTHNRSPDNCAKLLTTRENAKRKQEESFSQESLSRVKSSRRKSESDAETMRKVKRLKVEDDESWSANSSPKPKVVISCSECHQDYSSLYNLRRHMDRFHPEVKPPVKKEPQEIKEVERQEIQVFHCEECDKFFSSKASLNNHMISHTDKYKCSNCSQGFSCRRYLEQHSRNRSNCDKLLLKKQKESLLNASYMFNPRDYVETIIQGEEIKNNNS